MEIASRGIQMNYYTTSTTGPIIIINAPEPPEIYISGYIQQPYQVSPCTYCSNNPNNGGSGICHCILGTPKIY